MAFDITSYILAKKALDAAMEEVPHLEDTGKIPAENLPSYVDDIKEAYLYQDVMYEDAEHTIALVAETGKIYVDLITNFTYRWSGSTYVRVNDVDLSDYDTRAQVQAKIQTETDRATAAENALSGRVTAIENDYLTSREYNVLEGAIAAEEGRASTAEGELSTAINTETTRATAAEGELSTEIQTEVTRATTAEGNLRTAINTEVTNRQDAVSAEATRAAGAEQAIAGDLAQEISDRTADVDAEETRATTAENALSGRVTAIENDYLTSTDKTELAGDISSEVSRAGAAESGLSNRITAIENDYLTSADKTELAGNISSEVSRASTAENGLSGRITTIENDYLTSSDKTELAGDISSEASRAGAAETDLSGRITAIENDYLTSSDKAELTTAIQTENTRAVAAETALSNSIDAERTARNNDITKVGELLGFEKNVSTQNFELTNNGYVKTTKNLADNNKARLDYIENSIEVTDRQSIVKNNLTVHGDLVVEGTTTTTDQETIQSQSSLIVTNATNAPLASFSGVVVLKGTFQEYAVTASNYNAGLFYYKNGNKYILDESNSYTEGRTYYVPQAEAASIYDKTEDALMLGEGYYLDGNFTFNSSYIMITLTEHSYVPNKYYIKVNDNYVLATGEFDPSATYYARVSQGQHLATRVDSNYLVDKHLIEWDGNSFIFIDSGKTIGDIESEISNVQSSLGSRISTIENDYLTSSDKTELSGSISSEASRASTAESGLSGRITTIENDYLTSSDKTELSGSISSEASRAGTAESGLSGRITAIENDYLTSSDKTELSGAITSEASRAGTAESGLSGRITAIENDYLTSSDKNELSGAIEAAQSDWTATTGLAVILHKPKTEEWTFVVKNNDGTTTTVTKNVYVD